MSESRNLLKSDGQHSSAPATGEEQPRVLSLRAPSVTTMFVPGIPVSPVIGSSSSSSMTPVLSAINGRVLNAEDIRRGSSLAPRRKAVAGSNIASGTVSSISSPLRSGMSASDAFPAQSSAPSANVSAAGTGLPPRSRNATPILHGIAGVSSPTSIGHRMRGGSSSTDGSGLGSAVASVSPSSFALASPVDVDGVTAAVTRSSSGRATNVDDRTLGGRTMSSLELPRPLAVSSAVVNNNDHDSANAMEPGGLGSSSGARNRAGTGSAAGAGVNGMSGSRHATPKWAPSAKASWHVSEPIPQTSPTESSSSTSMSSADNRKGVISSSSGVHAAVDASSDSEREDSHRDAHNVDIESGSSSSGGGVNSASVVDSDLHLTSRKPMGRRQRLLMALMVFFITVSYGISMFLNGTAARLLPQRQSIYTHPDVPMALRIIARIPEPLYVLCSGRGLALAIICVVMWWQGDMPHPPDMVSKRLFLPLACSVCNTLGYTSYMALTSLGGVALWTSMLGASVAIPVAYGILVRHESAGRRKLIGIAACIAAALLLGLSGALAEPEAAPTPAEGDNAAASSAPPDSGPWWLCPLLFALSLGFWSTNDTLSAYLLTFVDDLGRPLHMFNIAIFNAAGFLLASWAAAGATYSLKSLEPTLVTGAVQPTPSPQVPDIPIDGTLVFPDPLPWMTGNAVLFAGNLFGSAAWYVMVKLATYGEASSYMPLISLQAFIPALLGISFLGERMGGLGYGGMLVAAGGVVLIATSK